MCPVDRGVGPSSPPRNYRSELLACPLEHLSSVTLFPPMSLLPFLQNFLAVFLQRVSEVVKQQRKVLQLDSTDSQSEERPVDEWSQFQSAFELIACCGEMVLNSSKLSSTLCQSVSSRAPVLRTPASRDIPFGPYNYLAKRDPQQLQSLYNMMASVEKGEDARWGVRTYIQLSNNSYKCLCTYVCTYVL